MRPFAYTLLRCWHLLSLDAPTVAALWCWAFGRADRLRLAPWIPVALALGTWLFYVADRLLDARLLAPTLLEERHRFHDRHRRQFLVAVAPVSMILAILILRMPRSLILAYSALGLLSLLYLGLVHLPAWAHGRGLRYFPKELAIALLFAAASALPAWDEARSRAAGMPHPHPLRVLCPLFALLCWLNCVAIEEWEHGRRGHGITWLAAFVILGGLLGTYALANHPARWLAASVVLSAALFLWLDTSRLSSAGRRIAADLALLTPVLLPFVTRLIR